MIVIGGGNLTQGAAEAGSRPSAESAPGNAGKQFLQPLGQRCNVVTLTEHGIQNVISQQVAAPTMAMGGGDQHERTVSFTELSW